MTKSFPSVVGFEHLKGPALLAATAMGLLAFVILVETPTLIEARSDFPVVRFALACLGEGIALAEYLALLLFFFLFYRRLVDEASATSIGRSALLAAIAIFSSTTMDTYFRLALRWNWLAFVKWLFVVGVIPMLALALFLTTVALRSLSLTSPGIRKISAVLAVTMGLEAILRTRSLVVELIKIGFRAEWSMAGWWNFLLQPVIPVVGSIGLATFFLGIWRSDAPAIRRVCSAPSSVARWAAIQFGSLSKLSKVLLILETTGAASVLVGSVTYVSPYSTIWSLLGRVLLLPGSAVAVLIRSDRLDIWQGLLDNFVYTVVAVMLNAGLYLLALGLSKSIRFHPKPR